MQRRNIILLSASAVLGATLAFAAAAGDRLKIPVVVGQGQAVLEKITFDQGGANPVVQATSGGSLQLSTDGTNFLTIPAISDTAVGLAATQTLTNKTLGSPTITGTVAGNPTFSGTVQFSGAIGGSPNFTGFITAAAASASSPAYGFASEGSGMYLAGTHELGWSVNTALVMNLTSATLTAPSATLTTTGGNTPHSCVIRQTTSTGTVDTNCSAGEIATGGGCLTTGDIRNSSPIASSTTPVGWECREAAGGSLTTYAICCQT